MNLSEEELPKALQKHAKEENINTNKKEKNKFNNRSFIFSMVYIYRNYNIYSTG